VPAHPYTAGLLASTVHDQPRGKKVVAIAGTPPDMRRLPPGCSFGPRCPLRRAECLTSDPEPRFLTPDRMARCLAVEAMAITTQQEHHA
jgi:peptide/nickel transport system ATP-binding protein